MYIKPQTGQQKQGFARAADKPDKAMVLMLMLGAPKKAAPLPRVGL
jgi:hypothetical protein